MTYKGYEIRNDAKTKFHKNGEVIEVEAWGIYRNGDYRGSVKTPNDAKDYIDGLTQGELTRPKEVTRVIQRTDYNTHGRIDKTTRFIER